MSRITTTNLRSAMQLLAERASDQFPHEVRFMHAEDDLYAFALPERGAPLVRILTVGLEDPQPGEEHEVLLCGVDTLRSLRAIIDAALEAVPDSSARADAPQGHVTDSTR